MKINIKLQATSSSTRLPKGLEEDAYEYALHQVSLDRDIMLSHIKRSAEATKKFNHAEVNNDWFIKGIERAEIDLKTKNANLRGSILWTK